MDIFSALSSSFGLAVMAGGVGSDFLALLVTVDKNTLLYFDFKYAFFLSVFPSIEM
jgi:hypothetical protein